ncbi:endonuclease/exonuclease/phosphatase family protein [Taibaiella helva]|uniref:endonuclease/exonuclease/phosphatase family protein n=1 Tax=Taibaiella helva TaxID=2301235 RepID=UPI0013006B52|nr:endonuclease/exonuclease/phosphatase family protein [Taibaiella helva]
MTYNRSNFKLKYTLSLFFCGLFGILPADAALKIASWNLQHLGRHKPDSTIRIMADCLKHFDLVALQEINTRDGAEGLAALVASLNRTGQQWDYRISPPTTTEIPGESERYAFIWKKAKVVCLGRPFLAAAFAAQMSREPFIAIFRAEGQVFSLVNFHALPKKKQPERELKYLKFFRDSLQLPPPVFLGDFNCPQSHTVFNPLKKQYFLPALLGQATTLKQECRDGDCLASEYDNIFYPRAFFCLLKAGIVPFYKTFNEDMIAARKVSDHLPVYAELGFLISSSAPVETRQGL